MFVAVSLDTQELIVKQVRKTSSKFSSLNHSNLRPVGCAELLKFNSFMLFSFTCLTVYRLFLSVTFTEDEKYISNSDEVSRILVIIYGQN